MQKLNKNQKRYGQIQKYHVEYKMVINWNVIDGRFEEGEFENEGCI